MWTSFWSLYTEANRDQRLFLVKMHKLVDEVIHADVAAEKQAKKINQTKRVRPTQQINYEVRVRECLEAHGPLLRSHIEKLTHGKSHKIRNAIVRMEENGDLYALLDGRLSLTPCDQTLLSQDALRDDS